MTEKQKTGCEIMALVAMMLLLTFLSGCSTMSIEYPEDKIKAIKDSLPDNVIVAEFDKPEDYPADISMHLAYTKFNALPGTHIIYTIAGNVCLMEHEAKHIFDGPGHDGWNRRLMECEA